MASFDVVRAGSAAREARQEAYEDVCRGRIRRLALGVNAAAPHFR